MICSHIIGTYAKWLAQNFPQAVFEQEDPLGSRFCETKISALV